MGEIKLLDKITQNQIAAGEVIDRPSSVLKELLENSIDAKANKILIELNNGGKTLIKVLDNGKGIASADFNLLVQRYATSKIKNITDLQNINSFGFRGEALASIAAVSRIVISSQKNKDLAKKMVIEGGKIIDTADTDTLSGTDVSIEGLFFNVPARKKFLKNDSTELRNCVKVITQIALKNHKIAFILKHNGKLLLDLPICGSWFDRISDLYPQNISKYLIPISFNSSDISVKGFISKPEGLKKQKYYQSLYINNRLVTNNIVYKALIDGYKGLVIKGLNPVFVLNVDISPELIDVNVHPQKKEVKILASSDLYRAVYSAVNQSLYPHQKDIRDDQAKKYFYKNDIQRIESISYEQNNLSLESDSDDIKVFNNIKILGQVHNSYILCETENEFWLVDQHAVHERILYEEYKKRLENGNNSKQKLMLPFTKELSKEELLVFIENKDLFLNLGFDIDLLDELTLIVEAIPDILIHTKFSGDYLDDIFNDLMELSCGNKKNITDIIDRKIKSMACRSAIKFGDKLNQFEMIEILEKLEKLEIPYCPHGRPAIVKLNWDELDRMFKRII